MKKKTKIERRIRMAIFGLPTVNRKEVKRITKYLRGVADQIEQEKDLKIYTKNPVFFSLMK